MVVLISPSEGAPPTAERDALVHRYLPLARGLATRYRHTHVPLEDLVQVASMGLVMAAGRFDASRGTSFASYAVRRYSASCVVTCATTAGQRACRAGSRRTSCG